jgi:hypothetical protein
VVHIPPGHARFVTLSDTLAGIWDITLPDTQEVDEVEREGPR